MFEFISRRLVLSQVEVDAETRRKISAPLRLGVSLCVVGFSLMLTSLLVAGQSDIAQSSVDYSFGQVLDFNLTLENPINVASVTLFFKAPEFENTYFVEVYETLKKNLNLVEFEFY